MTATIILTSVMIFVYLLDAFIFVPKGTKRLSKEHFINGDKTGYITKALTLDYKKIIKGQAWRLLSSVFLHVGIAHIVFNSLALLIAGYALETTIGWQKMLFGFFFSSLFSGIIICFGLKWEDGQGASTGIYGLIAVYVVLAIKNHAIFFSSLHPVFIVLLGIYTIVGMCLSKINRWEHSTGFIGGLLFGLLFVC